jgi:putative transposase
LGLNVEHRQHKGLNNRAASTTGRRNRAKNAHLPTLSGAKIIKRSTSARHLKRLVFIHDPVANLHNSPRHAMSSSGDRTLRSGAIIVWREIAEPGIAAERQGKSAKGKAPREKLSICARPPCGKLTAPSLMAV